jgi:hypothetical protein
MNRPKGFAIIYSVERRANEPVRQESTKTDIIPRQRDRQCIHATLPFSKQLAGCRYVENFPQETTTANSTNVIDFFQ